MERFLGMLRKIEYGFIGACLAGMVGIVFLATVARYTKWFVTPWAEEAARYLMIWLAFVGAGAVAKTGSHFGVDILVKRIPERYRAFLYAIQILVISGICLWIGYYGLYLCKNQIMTGQDKPVVWGCPCGWFRPVFPIRRSLSAFRIFYGNSL